MAVGKKNVSKKNLMKALIKYDGNHTQAAKSLGLAQATVTKRVNQNPKIKQAILNVREEALKKAGLTRSFVYLGIKKGCQAQVVAVIDGIPVQTKLADHTNRHKFLKTALELHKDLDPDKEQSVQNIATVIFNLIQNPNRQVIEVA